MISRATSMCIAVLLNKKFTSKYSSGRRLERPLVTREALYDFLYENEYDAWFCNAAKMCFTGADLKEFWLKLHTGESFSGNTVNWSWEQRRKLGQQIISCLISDFLGWYDGSKVASFVKEEYQPKVDELLRRLALDGYAFRDGRLLQTQADVLNVEEEKGLLQDLYIRSGLGRSADAFEFLRLGEEHFVEGRWSDCISNIRKFFELTLQEGAKILIVMRKVAFNEADLTKPVKVREFLENEGLVARKEREAIDKLYGLLSETGAHPYMAESDQARLLRQLSLTLSQFVLLRLEAATALTN